MTYNLTDQGLSLRQSLVIHHQPAARELGIQLSSHNTGSSTVGLVSSTISPQVSK